MDDDKGVGGAVEKGFSTDLVTDKAIRWIKERTGRSPFLCSATSRLRTNRAISRSGSRTFTTV